MTSRAARTVRVTRLVSCNVHRLQIWPDLVDTGADVALVQEATGPIGAPHEVLPGGEGSWATSGWEQRPWRTAIARLTDRVALDPIISGEIAGKDRETLPISRAGTITAARVLVDAEAHFTAVSVYAPFERYLKRDRPIWADGSAHRILSDLAPLLWDHRREPVIVAGDWNIPRGYGDDGIEEYKRRYDTVFDRAEALELAFVGPEYPNGRRAEPWPAELPEDSTCVPTYFRTGQGPPTATRQLDFVFASKFIADRVSVRALNQVSEWGRSDHCRIVIDVDI